MRAPAAPVLTLDEVGLRYPGGHTVFADVSLRIAPGSFTFLSGGSGVGKSSLLNIMGLALPPSEGRLSLFGQEITALPRASLPALRQRIGMVFQDYRLIEHLSIAENVGLPLKIIGENRSVIAAKVEELLAWVGLLHHYHARPETLSGGQKQRAAIARAVITAPDIVLADEPSGNLDAKLRLKFMHLFTSLHRSGTSVVFATHDDALMAMFDYPVLRLQDGKVVKER